MSVLPLLSWTVLLLVQSCGSSSDPASRPLSLTVHPHHQPLPDVASSSHCPSCALARMRRNEGDADDVAGHDREEEAQQDVVEAVKRHILNMLHLQARPNITRPVPRAALLNALRKLHVGRVAEDGSVQIEGEEETRGRGGRGEGGGGAAAARVADSGDAQETTEIITFAEAGECAQLSVCVCVCESIVLSFCSSSVWRENLYVCVSTCLIPPAYSLSRTRQISTHTPASVIASCCFQIIAHYLLKVRGDSCVCVCVFCVCV